MEINGEGMRDLEKVGMSGLKMWEKTWQPKSPEVV